MASTSAWKSYSFDEVELSTPKNWTDGTIVTIVGPDDGGPFSPSIVVTRDQLPDKTILGVYGEKQKKQLVEGELEGFELIDEGLEQSADPPHFRLSFCWDSEEQDEVGTQVTMRLRHDQYFVVRKDEVFTVTMSCLAERYGEVEPVFGEIFKNIRFP